MVSLLVLVALFLFINVPLAQWFPYMLVLALYVSTSGLVPAYTYDVNSMVSLYVNPSGLVPA